MPTSVESPVTIHFLTQKIDQQKEGFAEALETVELVRAGQALATLPPESPGPTVLPGQKARPMLIAGANTQLSPQGDTLSAIVAGYPHIVESRDHEAKTITISITPLITTCPRQMEASLTLYPAMPGTPLLQADELEALIFQHGIRYGLNREILRNCLKVSDQEQDILTAILVARGTCPVDGTDAHLRFEIDMGSIPGKLLGNGKIDFHERQMFISVRKGELIATKVPATTGSPGINVLGQPSPQKPGQDITVKAGDNVTFDESSGEIRATRSGILSVAQQTIRVTPKLSIAGDIDFSTGNIEADDALDIGGSVQPGFQVNVQGNLKIGGGVRAATVISQSNIQIQEGVSGQQATIRAKGDIDAHFVEQATMTAGGAIIIRKQAYYSRIFAGGDIHCPDDSRTMGGVIIAGGNLSLGQVGSDFATPATIAAGTSGKQYLRYEALHQELREKEKELEHCLQQHGRSGQHSACCTISEELEEIHSELEKINLAVGDRSSTPEEQADRLRRRAISIHGQIFAGTLLRIGNVTRIVKSNMTARKFALSEDLLEIRSFTLA